MTPRDPWGLDARPKRSAHARRVRDLARHVHDLGTHARAEALSYVEWTAPQQRWLAEPRSRKLLRAGNQIGKSWAGLGEVIYRCIGRHPYLDVRPPPIEAWVVCTTWAQSVAIMRKFAHLCPQSALIDGQVCDPRRGYGRENPSVLFRNGSIVRFRTTNQGPAALAGATVDLVLVDEPCDEAVYRELDRRVTRRGGVILLTLTPVNRPCEYLRELCERGVVADHHVRMTPDAFVAGGRVLRLADGTPMDAAWIEDQHASVLPHVAPVILDGHWEMAALGAVFRAFDTQLGGHHVHDRWDVAGVAQLVLGLDHGSGARFSQAASLSAVAGPLLAPRVRILDEVVSDGETTTEQDAAAVLAMLARHGRTWADLDVIVGDRPWGGASGNADRLNVKSNAKFLRAVADKLGVDASTIPQIRTAKRGRRRGAGSKHLRADWVHRLTLRAGGLSVDPRAVAHIASLSRWDYTDSSPHKHVYDALVYGLDAWIFADDRIRRASPRVQIAA